MPGDCLHIRVETCDGEPEAEHVFVIPFMIRGERAYFMVKGIKTFIYSSDIIFL